MNIIYIANARIPTEKAHGYQIIKMCEAMAKKGCTIELIVPCRKHFVADDPFLYWNTERLFRIIELPATDLISNKIVPRRIAFLIDAASFMMQSFYYVRKKKDTDVIYVRDREMAFLSLVLKTPTIFEIHFLPRFVFLYRILWRRLYKIITITHALKELLIKNGFVESHIVVLPDAVDLALFDKIVHHRSARIELNIRDDQFVILYAGQLFSWKGVKTLLNASDFLPHNCLVMIVGGTAADIDAFREYAAKNVVFIGQHPVYEVPRFLKAADVLVLPNSGKYAISRYYTSPLKLFEYMASGIPMIVSDLPSLREIVSEKEAIFFEPDNPRDLARAIQEVAHHQEAAKNRAQEAQKKVRQHTWEKRAERLCAILKAL